MSETKNTRRGRSWRSVDEEEAVRRLIEEAGPRPALPQDDLASIRVAAHAEWRRRYSDRGAHRTPARLWMPLAAAALLAAVGLLWWARSSRPASGLPAGSIELLTGAVRWQAAGESAVQLPPNAVGRPLLAGSKVTTGVGPESSGRLALRMAGGASVRLDSDTRARFASATVVELERGAVYVDTGAEPRRREEVAVWTPAGVFEGVGTQFEVRAEGGAAAMTRLRVREGSVGLDRAGESVLTETGNELIVRGDGSLIRRRIQTYGPEWDWVVQAAPMPDIEGMKVRAFLDWIARETGLRVEIADDEAASLCDSTVLHGSIAHLTPAEAPRVVLSSAGLGHRVADGTLVVFVAEKRGG